jgi:hypothetical protein
MRSAFCINIPAFKKIILNHYILVEKTRTSLFKCEHYT